MPMKAPRICGCGSIVPATQLCACQIARDQDRKRRFDARRPNARQRGYTVEWDVERKQFLADNPACRMPGCNKPATVVDHIQPHKGNQRLFWNRSNWQPLCTPCHSSRKQAMERR